MINLERIIIVTPQKAGFILPKGFGWGFPVMTYTHDLQFGDIREMQINFARERLKQFIKSQHNRWDIVLCIDSDVNTNRDNLIELCNKSKVGLTPAINTKGHIGGHIVCSCCAVNIEDYIKINFLADPMNCACSKYPNPYYIDLAGSETNRSNI